MRRNQFYSQPPTGNGIGQSLYKSSPAVFSIIGITLGVFILQIISSLVYQIGNTDIVTFALAINPPLIIHKFFLWQFVTYLFTHGGIFHIFFNMFALFMFGRRLERLWGAKEFVKYYLITGVFAGICSFAFTVFTNSSGIYPVTVGASGAIYGLLIAFGMIWPNEKIYIWGVLPIKSKYLVIILGLIELFSQLSGGRGNIAHLAHLGGLAAGYVYLILRAKNYHRKKTQEKIIDLETFIEKKKQNEKVDKILDKVIESGIESLTPQEKQILIDAGKYFKDLDKN